LHAANQQAEVKMPTYQKIVWIGLGVTAIAILILGYFLFLAPKSEKKAITLPETSSLAVPRQEPAPAAVEENDPDIVPLDLDPNQSDGAVREMIAAAAVPAALRQWSRQVNLVRTVTAAVDSIALGLSPAAQLPFMAPAGKFSTLEKNGKIILDPRSFSRYDPMVNAFVAVEDKVWINWYKKLRPTLERAFRELGYPDVTFSQRLQQASEQLLQVPLIAKDIELEKKVMSYAYADINLEDLNPVQKHLLRMGPGNIARIQNKLRTLMAGLNRSRNKSTR
jgi:hypothetical protein